MAKKKTLNGVNLVTMVHPQSAAAEAFRILRTNLGFTSPEHPCQSLLVTSPGLDDGKTLTACNLAVVLAQAGHKVLLVDCDLRQPLIHRLFSLENEHGFTNTLLYKRLAGGIHRVNQGLSVLTSGPVPPNPAEIISANKTRAFWQEQLKSFDYLVVDSPPVLAVTDASLLAAQLDGVLLVLNATSTRIDMAQEAKEQLLKVNARIIGVVLNRVKIRKKDYYYYYPPSRKDLEASPSSPW